MRHLSHPRHGREAVDHDVALGFVNAHGHRKAAVMQFLVQHFGIAVQPAYPGVVGGIDGEIPPMSPSRFLRNDRKAWHGHASLVADRLLFKL